MTAFDKKVNQIAARHGWNIPPFPAGTFPPIPSFRWIAKSATKSPPR